MHDSDLKITDLSFFDLDDMPKRVTLVKICTNQGIVGFGELRDASLRTYGLMLKGRLLGENPLCVDKLIRRIWQFGYHARQGGGVSGIEVALWDIVGKYWGVPCWQLLGGKYRDRIRVYCDTDVDAGGDCGRAMGLALKKRMEAGYTMLKMDLGVGLLINQPGMISAPLGLLDEMRMYGSYTVNAPHGSASYDDIRLKAYEMNATPHPFTGLRITEKGLDYLEEYVRQVREIIGYEIPLAIDHFGHVCVEDCIRFARRMEKYGVAWLEDMVPWQYAEQNAALRKSCAIPICTGEDIYGKAAFEKLIHANAVSMVHPDVLTAGGMLETKKIGDLAYDNGVACILHMAESPVGAMAAVHVAAALPQVMAMEFHSADTPHWQNIVTGIPKPLIRDGFIEVPNKPGLGIDDFAEDVLLAHANKMYSPRWADTSDWNNEVCNDRLWS